MTFHNHDVTFTWIVLSCLTLLCCYCCCGFRITPKLFSPSQNPHHQQCQPTDNQYRQRTTELLSLRYDDVNSNIKVYDNVFDADTCYEIHQLAMDHSNQIGSDESTIFYRTNDNLTQLEVAIDMILRNIIKESTNTINVVEYWARQEYINMDTHCDIDENMYTNTKSKIIRCPDFAHIFYLYMQQQGTPSNTSSSTNLIAPTCIFPDKQGGWIADSEYDDARATTSSTTDLVVIPAVAGRVVRFPGNAMHAVPKPPTKWLMSQREQQIHDDDEEFNDDDYDTTTKKKNTIRSVLLFNCWSNNNKPPIGVKTYSDYMDTKVRSISTTNVPDGIVLDENEEDDTSIKENIDGSAMSRATTATTTKKFRLNDNFSQTMIVSHIISDGTITSDGTSVICNNRTSNVTAAATTSSAVVTNSAVLNIRLMGNKSRRKFNKNMAKLMVDNVDTLYKALREPMTPSIVRLSNKDADKKMK